MLTDKEKQIIERAFELIDNDLETYSCLAIDECDLQEKYGKFYRRNPAIGWDIDSTFRSIFKAKQARLMLLATFWELG